jgi:hypothetical protein
MSPLDVLSPDPSYCRYCYLRRGRAPECVLGLDAGSCSSSILCRVKGAS